MTWDYSYVQVELTTEFEKELIAVLLEAGIAPCSKHDFHCTVMYDSRKGNVPEQMAELDPTRIFSANIVSLDVLGDGLVFHLSSRDLHEEFQRLVKAGHQPLYPDYLPHMSIMYDPNQYDVLKVKHLLADWAGRKITFNNESFGFAK